MPARRRMQKLGAPPSLGLGWFLLTALLFIDFVVIDFVIIDFVISGGVHPEPIYILRTIFTVARL
jgi:hypothetical protein